MIEQLSSEFKRELRQLYGDEFLQLILFGSYARFEQDEDSDIDFAIVLKSSSIKSSTAILQISPISTKLGLQYQKVISVFPVSSERLRVSNQGIFQSIREEGVTI